MIPPREASAGRFRSTLLGRTQRVVELMPHGHGLDADADVRKELLGELHTLKGEARMLGLSLLSTLAHALEDAFVDSEIGQETIVPVLDSILLALSEGTPDELAQELLGAGLDALGRGEAAGEFASSTSQEVETAPTAASDSKRRWIHVDAQIVEELCEALATLDGDFGAHTAQLRKSLGTTSSNRRALDHESQRLRARLSDALSLSLGLRLAPLEPELARLAAHVRRAASEKQCPTEVIVQANGVQVEREVLDLMGEPLIHLANNAIEHGVARRPDAAGARVVFRAENIGTSVVVRVEDNGPGIDAPGVWARAVERGLVDESVEVPSLERVLPLIFEPGFSTRDEVDQGAGRGVGLDVVQRQAHQVGGSVGVENATEGGTSFVLSIPAALTRVRTLVIRVDDSLFGIPVEWVEQILAGDDKSESPTHLHEGTTLPRRSLSRLFAMPAQESEPGLILLRLGERRVVVTCHRIIGQYELVRRPTSRGMSLRFGVSANAQLDDGRLVLMVERELVERGLGGAEAARRTPGPARQGPLVLVVDDSIVVRDLIREVLVEAGYRVETAQDGVEGLERFESSSVDLVLSDIEMPRLDGFGFLTELRKRSPTLPIVMLSAKSSNEDRLRASTLGASAYVAKREFESQALVNVVQRYLARDS